MSGVFFWLGLSTKDPSKTFERLFGKPNLAKLLVSKIGSTNGMCISKCGAITLGQWINLQYF